MVQQSHQRVVETELVGLGLGALVVCPHPPHSQTEPHGGDGVGVGAAVHMKHGGEHWQHACGDEGLLAREWDSGGGGGRERRASQQRCLQKPALLLLGGGGGGRRGRLSGGRGNCG